MADLTFLAEQLPHLLFGLPARRPGGLFLSLLLLVAAFPAGFLIALPVALIRQAGAPGARPWLRIVAALVQAATVVLRGVPLVLLLILIHLLTTQRVFGEGVRDWVPAWLALTLVTAADQSMILSGGLQAVPVSAREAAMAAGLTWWQRVSAIEAPIATRAVLPALIGQAISIFKDTSVVFILALPELFTTANHILNGGNERYFLAMYLALGGLYFLPAWAISRLAGRWERSLWASPARARWLHLGFPS